MTSGGLNEAKYYEHHFRANCVDSHGIAFHERISRDDLVHYFGTAEKDEDSWGRSAEFSCDVLRKCCSDLLNGGVPCRTGSWWHPGLGAVPRMTPPSAQLPEYELVSPQHVRGSRKRRGLYEDKEPLEYLLEAFGEKYHLHLQHNKELISPGCLVYKLQSTGQRHVEPCPVGEGDCYYLGSSLSHYNSSAAVSTCDGLHGIISVPTHDLLVQPIRKQHIPILLSSQPINKAGQYVAASNAHIVYKMAPTKRSCGLQAAADSMLKVLRRRRRQAGRKYMEFLLAADKTMFSYHGNHLQHYMLTAANVAAGRYLDPSLQQEIYLTVVRIKILQDDQPGLVITSDADSSLNSFCNWQEKFNPENDNDPQHVDAATLMTRTDLIHLGVQSTTGLASLSGMCTRDIRCSILEDNGLDIGLTFAHETGHSLGMNHDGENNFCDDRQNIMSASGAGGSTAFLWSSCSVDALNSFLSSGKGSCLTDAPQNGGYDLPRDLPGVLYDGTDQCELFIKKGSSLCTGTSLVDRFGGDECAKLICFDPNLPGQCTGSQAPRMDGTECGHRKWCIHGQCVDIGPNGPAAQDGGWSNWDAEWSLCSRSCGGGVRTKTRKCNSPKPLFGGKPCEGFEAKAELCNMQPCASSTSYKAQQCAATDKYPLFNQNFHFRPANVEGKDQCKLYCEVEGQSTIHLRTLNGKQQFADGTDCSGNSGAFHRCVSGVCRAFSCDGSTETQRTYDKCGVCNGDNSSCKKVTGQYQRGEAKKYSTFASIPRGATSIYITNQNKYSVMSISVNGIRYFNGADGHRDRSGKYSGGGVIVDYRRNPEKITIDGPLSVNIEAQHAVTPSNIP
ncbi:A disintegrin and metalloproteinase with thrombospondin motifs 16-like [Gigantopelta aegis]|uniref:A disintegrin and metalloproteinase with thrombospondin motifs 16-like n=1 Tax=Gigantopelta aegis TaxID=1735272 RepID=UPI001B88DB6F|nr:A disintegrin and metalloproteinase with thrombospondin motifs 16-like [Gigantopelta aegis]